MVHQSYLATEIKQKRHSFQAYKALGVKQTLKYCNNKVDLTQQSHVKNVGVGVGVGVGVTVGGEFFKLSVWMGCVRRSVALAIHARKGPHGLKDTIYFQDPSNRLFCN